MESIILSAFNNSAPAVAIYIGYRLLQEFPDMASKYIDLWDKIQKRKKRR